MKKVLLFLGIFLVSFTSFSQDTIRVKNQVFEVLYSQNLESPLWLKYRSTNRPTNVNRGTMDFYTEKNIKTSDAADYLKNIYDKGHLAPAADFNCDKDNLFKNEWNNCKIFLKDNPQIIQNLGLDTIIENNFKKEYKNISPMYKLTYRFDYTKCNNNSIYTFIINELNNIYNH